jgi:hypothetical protein
MTTHTGPEENSTTLGSERRNSAWPPGKPLTLSQEIRRLTERFKERPVLVSEVLAAVHGRGYDLLLILLSLPFLTPIPLPLLSSVFGTIVLIAGTRLALGQRPWWPAWALNKQLPAKFFPRFLVATSRVISVIEYLVKPRLEFFHDWVLFQRIAGILIALSGALLLLPVPVPLSNFFPALTVALLASGALERDGFFFLGGCVSFCLSVAYFSLLFLGGREAVRGLLPMLGGGS